MLISVSILSRIFFIPLIFLISGFILKTIPASEKIGSTYSVSFFVVFFSPTSTSSVTFNSPSSFSIIISVGIASIRISPFSFSKLKSIPKNRPPFEKIDAIETSPFKNFATRLSLVALELLLFMFQSIPSRSKRFELVSIIVPFIIICSFSLSSDFIILFISSTLLSSPLKITLLSIPITSNPKNPLSASVISFTFLYSKSTSPVFFLTSFTVCCTLF